ncbi:MAG: hypothetical protein R3F30_01810 [Planctomycetota bacterium]
MLRRSFSVLLAFLLLGLVMILGYALFLQEGSADALRHAAEELRAGDAAGAVRRLGLAQRALGPSAERELLHDLHVLRAEAHARLRNWDKALADIELVLGEYDDVDPGPRDRPGWPYADGWPFTGGRDELLRRRIRYMLRAGRLDDARAHAEAFVEAHPDDHLGLDLAGQVMQSLYQERLAELQQENLAVQVSERMRLEILDVAIPFLYTHEGDPGVARLQAELARRLDRILDPVTGREIGDSLVEIRHDIAACRRYYEAALVGPVEVPASLQGYAGILLRAGRCDEAAALAWLYLQRFPDGRSATIAARQAMEAELDLGVPELALRVGRTWLASRPAEALRCDWDHAQAFESLARALHELGQAQELADEVATIDEVERREGRRLGPESDWIHGLLADLRGNDDELERRLAAFCATPSVRPRPAFGPDLFLRAMELRLAAAEDGGRYEVAAAVLREWIGVRPREPKPRLALARILTDRLGEHRAAAKECQGVLDLPRDQQSRDEALRTLLVAVDRLNEPKGSDSASLFRQLAFEHSTLHRDLPHPILHYGIAIQAWLAGEPAFPILEANLDRFLDAYPYSSDGRVLRAQLDRLRGEYAQVAFDADRVLEGDPDHLAAGLLRLEALEAGDAPAEARNKARLDLLERHPGRVETARRMGELLLAREAWDEALLVAGEGRAAQLDPTGLAWIRGRALLELDRPAEALRALKTVKVGDADRVPALCVAIDVAAGQRWSDELPGLATALEAAGPDPADRMRAAARLCRAGRGDLALSVLEPLRRSQEEVAIEARNGKFFVLAARAARCAGRDLEARDMAMRALGFADAGPAGTLAVAFALVEGRVDDARQLAEDLAPLQGSPLLRAWIATRLGDHAGAKALLAAAGVRSEALAAMLRAALTVLAAPGAEPAAADRCGVAALDTLAAKHAADLLEAMAMAAEPALRPRGDEVLQGLREAGALAEDATLSGAVAGLLGAWQAELAGDLREATRRLAGQLDTVTFKAEARALFQLVHGEFFRVGEPFAALLDNDELLRHYNVLLTFVGPGPLQPLGIPLRALLGSARKCREVGALRDAAGFLEAARALDPKDPALLGRLAEVRLAVGDVGKALRARAQQLDLLEGHDRLEAFRTTLDTLVDLAEAGKLDEPGLEGVVAPLRRMVQDWVEAPSGPEHPPLGRAALLEVRQRWEGQRELADRIVRATLDPYLEGRIPTAVDPDGIVALLGWLQDHGQPEVGTWIETLCELDPSVAGLWLLSAREKVAGREVRAAERMLSRLADYLPDLEVLDALGRVRGRFGLGSHASRSELLDLLERKAGSDERTAVARGLLRLRLGEPERCLDLLEGTEDPELEGLRALAGILAGRPDANETVLALLDKWTREHRFLASAPVLAAQVRALVDPR